MKKVIVFLGLILVQSMGTVSAQEEQDLMQNAIHRNTLSIHGNNAKICLKLIKQKSQLGVILTEVERLDIILALKSYLDALNNFHIYIGIKPAPEKNEGTSKN